MWFAVYSHRDSRAETRRYDPNTVPDESLHDVQTSNKYGTRLRIRSFYSVPLATPCIYTDINPFFLAHNARHIWSIYYPQNEAQVEHGRRAFLHVRVHVAGSLSLPFQAHD